MGNADQVLGELKEFKRSSIEEFRAIRREIRELSAWRFKMEGARLAVTAALVEIIHVIFLRG